MVQMYPKYCDLGNLNQLSFIPHGEASKRFKPIFNRPSRFLRKNCLIRNFDHFFVKNSISWLKYGPDVPKILRFGESKPKMFHPTW